MNLQQLRAKINKIDASILSLLAKRQALMPAIGKYKKDHGLPIYQAAREREVLKALERMAVKKNLQPQLARSIFKALFKNSKKIQIESTRKD